MNDFQKLRIKTILSKITNKSVSETDESIKRIAYLSQELNARHDDTILLLLGIFEGYHSALAKTPRELQEILSSETRAFKDKQQERENNLLNTVNKKLQLKITNEKFATIFKWAILAVFFSLLSTGIIAYFLYNNVYSEAFESAYYKAHATYTYQDEWAQNSPLISEVIKLDQQGILEKIIECSGDGWVQEEIDGKIACLPTTGWYME